jgi:ferredoxin
VQSAIRKRVRRGDGSISRRARARRRTDRRRARRARTEHDDPAGLSRRRIDTPTLRYPDAHAGQRAALRRRGPGIARARASLLPRGRGDMVVRPAATAYDTAGDRAGCRLCLWICRWRHPTQRRMRTARPERFGADGARRQRVRTQARRARRARPSLRASRALRSTLQATVAQPAKIDNDLYVRDYSRAACYKLRRGVRHRRAEHVRDRGLGPRSTRGFQRSDRPLTDSACVYCGNCIGVCPTGALMFNRNTTCGRQARGTSRRRPSPTRSARTAAWATSVHVQGNQIVRARIAARSRRHRQPLGIKGASAAFVQNR